MNANDRWFISMWMCLIIFNIRGPSAWLVLIAGLICAVAYIFTDDQNKSERK